MPADPNWLLSTVAQSAAAFVAIIAGFIISRLLALSAERNGLETRIRDIVLQLKIKEENISALKKHLLDLDALDFLEDSNVFNNIIKSKGEISLIDAMKINTENKRSENELRPYWDDTITTTKNAFRQLEADWSKFPENLEDLLLFLKETGLNLSSHQSNIYYRVYIYLQSKPPKERKTIDFNMNSFASMVIPYTPDMSSINLDKNNRYRELEKDIEFFERERNSLEIQFSDLKSQRKHLGQPEGVKLGILVLAYFSLVGIVIPLIYCHLPLTNSQYFINGVFFCCLLVAYHFSLYIYSY